MDSKFYVYGYYHPITNILFYVGKGSGHRAYKHLQPARLARSKTYLTNKINKIKRLYDLLPTIKILHQGLTEDKAFEIEKTLIEQYGRKAYDPNGILTNMTTGGEGRIGLRHNAAARLKMSKARKGKPHTAEHSANIANALRGRIITEEQKQKISKSLQGIKHSPERKEKAARYRKLVGTASSTTWKLLDPDGNIHITSNLKKFCKKHNLSYTGIYKNKNKPIIRGVAKGWMTIDKIHSKLLNQLK